MKLKYRGQFYKASTKSIQTKKKEIIAKYRGMAYSASAGIENNYKPLEELTYRGINYNTRKLEHKTANIFITQPLFN